MIILYEWYISLKEKRQGYLNIIIVQCGILWHQWTSPAKAISEATPAGWKTLPFDVFNHFPAFVSLGRSPQVDSLWITCFPLSEKTSFEKKARCRLSACLLSLALVLQRATWFYRWSRGPVPFKRGCCAAWWRFGDGRWPDAGVVCVAWQAHPCLQPKNSLS